MPLSTLSPLFPVLEHPYESDRFFEIWRRFFQPKFKLQELNLPSLTIYPRPICRGFVKIRELRPTGWNTAIFHDFDKTRMAEFAQLHRKISWDYLIWDELASRHALQELEGLRSLGYQPVILPGLPRYSIDLSQGYEHYWSSLPSNRRSNLKRKIKNAEGAGAELLTYRDAAHIEPFFADFFKYHLAYWDQKTGHSYFNCFYEREFVKTWAHMFAERGDLRLHVLKIRNEVVNLSMSIRTGESLYWPLTINTGLYSELTPGIVSLHLRIREAAEEDARFFHMGYGNEQYKIQAANITDPCNTILVSNPRSLKGRLYVQYLHKKQAEAPDQNSKLE